MNNVEEGKAKCIFNRYMVSVMIGNNKSILFVTTTIVRLDLPINRYCFLGTLVKLMIVQFWTRAIFNVAIVCVFIQIRRV